MNEFASHLLMWYVHHHAYHQSASTHLGDVWLCFLQLPELANEIFAHLVCILHQLFLLKHVEHSQRRRAPQVVATKRGAELPIHRLKVWRNEQPTYWVAVGNAFSHSDKVGLDAQPLMGEETCHSGHIRTVSHRKSRWCHAFCRLLPSLVQTPAWPSRNRLYPVCIQ